jgi:hypothetical protein
VADSGDAPMYAGVVNRAPLLDRLFERGVVANGPNFISQKSKRQSGESGGFGTLDSAALLMLIQVPPLYRTTGEVRGSVANQGLPSRASSPGRAA